MQRKRHYAASGITDRSDSVNFLAVAVLGEERPETIEAVTRTIQECKCDILDSRLTVLGDVAGLLLLVQGNWNTLARLETQLQKLERSHKVHCILQRSHGFRAQNDLRPYAVEVTALERPAIVQRAIDFFNERGIRIEDMSTRSYRVPHTETPMMAIHLVVGIPERVHSGMLRDEFFDFCDEQDWDAVMEPVKS